MDGEVENDARTLQGRIYKMKKKYKYKDVEVAVDASSEVTPEVGESVVEEVEVVHDMRTPYEKRLDEAPDHLSEEFLDYLRAKNVVVYESSRWLIIENCKYHTREKAWWTAFYKEDGRYWRNYIEELEQFQKFDLLIKSPLRRTVQRFHIHLVEQL